MFSHFACKGFFWMNFMCMPKSLSYISQIKGYISRLISIWLKIFQACRSMGKDCRISMCHRWCVDHCTSGSCNCEQFQLLLSSWNRPGRDAESKLQPCYKLPLLAWYSRSVLFKFARKCSSSVKLTQIFPF